MVVDSVFKCYPEHGQNRYKKLLRRPFQLFWIQQSTASTAMNGNRPLMPLGKTFRGVRKSSRDSKHRMSTAMNQMNGTAGPALFYNPQFKKHPPPRSRHVAVPGTSAHVAVSRKPRSRTQAPAELRAGMHFKF